MLKEGTGFPKLLQPFPDFGFTNDLIFDEEKKADLENFWHVVSDFIFSENPRYERLKNFVNFQTDFFGNVSKEQRAEMQSIYVNKFKGTNSKTKDKDLDAIKT
jgi:hypothetical protein